MTDQLWPDEAREAVLKALYAHPHGDSVTTDAVLAALADHAVPRYEADEEIRRMASLKIDVHEELRAKVLALADRYRGAVSTSASVLAADLRTLAGGDQ